MYRMKTLKKLPAKEFQSHKRLPSLVLTILAILLPIALVSMRALPDAGA
jgi:hypothetical protein